MAEIIRQGDPEKRPTSKKTFECDNCGCRFKSEGDEYRAHTQYNETTYTSMCPNCGRYASEFVHL